MIRFGYVLGTYPPPYDGIVHERGYGASDTVAEEGKLVKVRVTEKEY